MPLLISVFYALKTSPNIRSHYSTLVTTFCILTICWWKLFPPNKAAQLSAKTVQYTPLWFMISIASLKAIIQNFALHTLHVGSQWWLLLFVG